MAVALTHTTVATGTDAGNAQIGKTQWNETHTLTMATDRLLGRTTAGTGAVEEITASTGLTLTAGALAVSKAFPTGDIVGTTDTQNLSNKTFTDNPTFSAGTANGVLYLNGSKVATSGSALVFDGTNLGIGVTPSAWGGSNKAIDIGTIGGVAADAASMRVVSNAYSDSGGTFRYKTTAAAFTYTQNPSIGHAWFTAPSGTAGNAISFTQAMTLDSSGNVNIAGLTASKAVFTDASKNLTSTGTLGVDQGGTGAATLTGIVKGNGTSAFTAAVAGTDYVTPSGSETLTNKTLTDPTIIGAITEDVFTITDGASVDINPGNGTIQLWTLGANRTPTATNFAAGESVTLMILDGTAYSVTWTTIGVVWVGGSAPTLDTTKYTVIELWKVSTTVYGAFVGYA